MKIYLLIALVITLLQPNTLLANSAFNKKLKDFQKEWKLESLSKFNLENIKLGDNVINHLDTFKNLYPDVRFQSNAMYGTKKIKYGKTMVYKRQSVYFTRHGLIDRNFISFKIADNTLESFNLLEEKIIKKYTDENTYISSYENLSRLINPKEIFHKEILETNKKIEQYQRIVDRHRNKVAKSSKDQLAYGEKGLARSKKELSLYLGESEISGMLTSKLNKKDKNSRAIFKSLPLKNHANNLAYQLDDDDKKKGRVKEIFFIVKEDLNEAIVIEKETKNNIAKMITFTLKSSASSKARQFLPPKSSIKIDEISL